MMNAYELADKQAFEAGELSMWTRNETANMLRQQATALDKVIPQLVKANGIIENLRIRIAELEKELIENNRPPTKPDILMEMQKQSEPVAWRSRWKNHKGEFITGWIVSLTNAENPDPRQVIEPLYTTPQTKPLTEEDIPFQKVAPKEVADSIDKALGLRRLSDEEIYELKEKYLIAEEDLGLLFVRGYEDFARAIEAKVRGEK